MPVQNVEIAGLFNRLADLLEIEDANPFRVRAYRNAARVIAGDSRSMADLLAEGRDLTELPGIGKDLAAKIAAIVRTGGLPQLEDVEKRTPRALSDLMQLPGLGPKRVKLLYRELKIRSHEDLLRAVRSGKLEKLPGFGPKIVEKIAAGLMRVTPGPKRLKLADAEQMAAPLVAYLKKTPGIKTVEVAGSYHRRQETVGDLDILAICADSRKVMRRFVKYDSVAEVLSQGETRSSVRLRSGLQVDLRVVPEVSYGAALYYFTGSKAHNIATRTLAMAKKLKINEYGVYRGAKRIAGRTEQELFHSLGMAYTCLNCARTAARSKQHARAGCRSSSPSRTSAAICTATPMRPTAGTAWSRWRERPKPAATNTSPSPIIPATSPWPAAWTSSVCRRRSRP